MAPPWTEGRKRAFIVSVLRAGSRRWPPKYETLNEAKTEKKKNTKTNRVAQHYLCAACGVDFPNTQVQVDHISPVVDVKTGFTTWDNYIDRLFCGKDNLQVLCKTCHAIKTKEEKQWKLTQSSKPKKAPTRSKVRSRKKNTTS